MYKITYKLYDILRLCILFSTGTNLQSIIDYSTKNKCDYKVSLVIANKKCAYGISRAQKVGIETKVRQFFI